jgi:tRNA(Ile)-lysidine synthase
LAAILPVRADGVIRPLLECRRSQVETAVRSLGLAYRVDASNADPRFLRTHVRHRLLPLLGELNPSIAESLAHAADLQRGQELVVRAWTAEQLERVTDGDALDLTVLRRLPAGVASYVVRGWGERVDPRFRGLAAVHVEALLDFALSARRSGYLTLPGGLRVRRRADRLVLGEFPAAAPEAVHVLEPGAELHLRNGWHLSARVAADAPSRGGLPRDLWSAVCAWREGDELRVRVARRGERVRPLGMQGRKKVSDLFIDHKVPSEERGSYPVVEHGGRILWVPGVVRAAELTVVAHTRQVVWLRAARDPSPRGS